MTSIPARFPLASGYPETNGDGTRVKVNEVGGSLPLQLCGREVATDADLLDAPKRRSAAPTRCARSTPTTPATSRSPGTESYRTDGAFDTGLTVYQVVRVGNALLLVTTYDGNAGPGDSVANVGEADATDALPVVRAMNVFAEH